MTNDGLNTITYDGEGRAVTASGGLGSGTYSYDGNGLRVKKVAGSTTTVYIFSGAKVIAEYANGAAPSSPTREYIYAGGALLARIDSSGTNYYHQDHLSNRIVTNSSGSVVAQMGHFPFGESWYNATNDKLYFTTYEYDSESGNHYAMARYHVSRLGRLSSPDPIAGSTANPQSLNRYSYSINDPANVTDPSGAEPVSGCTTAQANPKDKSEQASGGGHSDVDNSDAETDGDAGSADPPQQNGCVSHVNPYGSSGDFGSDWAAEFGVEGVGTFDGGPPMADVPPGMFTVTSIGGTQGIGNWIWLPPDTIQDFQGKGKDQQLVGSRSDPGEWLELGVPSPPGDSSDGNNGSSWWGTTMGPQSPTMGPGNRTPWYKNPCITSALGKGALQLGIDAIGLIPGTRVARMIGHQAGYVGKVADQVGSNVARATGASTSAANGLASLRDTSPLGLLSSVLTIGGFAPPPFSTAAAVGSIGVDVAKIWKASKNCN